METLLILYQKVLKIQIPNHGTLLCLMPSRRELTEGDFIVYVGLLRFSLILNTNCLILTNIYIITGTDHVLMTCRSQTKVFMSQ